MSKHHYTRRVARVIYQGLVQYGCTIAGMPSPKTASLMWQYRESSTVTTTSHETYRDKH